MTQTTSNLTRNIPGTDLDVFPLSLGGNVFGWTADAGQSFDVLDAYAAGGGNFVDTADVLLGLGVRATAAANRRRSSAAGWPRAAIATRLSSRPRSARSPRPGAQSGQHPQGRRRLAAPPRHRLHRPVLRAQGRPRHAARGDGGRVRGTGREGQGPGRRRVELQRRPGWPSRSPSPQRSSAPRYVALQPHYNLVHRNDFEGELAGSGRRARVWSTVPYYALASGFLTGKYRSGAADSDSSRAQGAARYLDEPGSQGAGRARSGRRPSSRRRSTSVALAWLAAQPTVIAPIASASKVSQVADLLASADPVAHR